MSTLPPIAQLITLTCTVDEVVALLQSVGSALRSSEVACGEARHEIDHPNEISLDRLTWQVQDNLPVLLKERRVLLRLERRLTSKLLAAGVEV